MTDTPPINATVSSTPEHITEQNDTRDERITKVAWLVGIVGVAAFSAMDPQMSVGAGMAFAAVSAMVTIVALAIIRTR